MGEVEIKLNGNKIIAKGSKGERTLDVDHALTVSLENEMITVTPKENGLRERRLHGLSRTLVKNLITGVNNGFEKKLCLLCVGFAHDVILPIPHGIDATVTQNTNITISGIDKSEVGDFAAKLRRVRPPEPYGGKGIRYVDEIIEMKEGKRGKK